MLTEPLRAVDLVVADAQLVARDPDDGSFGAESGVLEGALDELVALGGRKVFDFVGEAREEGVVGALALRVGVGVVSVRMGCGVGVAVGRGGGEVEFAAQVAGAVAAGAVGPGLAGEDVADAAGIERDSGARLVVFKVLHLDAFDVAVFFLRVAFAIGEDFVQVVVAFALLFSHFEALLLGAGELFVADDGVVFEGDREVAEEWREGLIEEVLVDDCKDEHNDHDDGLALAGDAVAVGVADKEEEAD